MAIKPTILKRKFKYGSISLPDPGPVYSPEQVKEFHSATYQELLTFVVEGPELKGDTQVWEFIKDVGTKG